MVTPTFVAVLFRVGCQSLQIIRCSDELILQGQEQNEQSILRMLPAPAAAPPSAGDAGTNNNAELPHKAARQGVVRA
jgi:hypothetical protein